MKHKFEQLYDVIKSDIHNLAAGTRLPRVRELMSQYDSAQITIQKVFDMLENEGLVKRHPGKGIFKSDGKAPENARQTLKIMLVLPMHPSPFFDSFSNFFLKLTEEMQYQPLICRYNINEPVNRWIHGNLRYDAVLAILPGMQLKTEIIGELGKLDCPVVVVDRYLNGLDINSVCTDNIAGGTLVANHFIDTGRSKSAILIAEPEISTVVDRAESFKRQMLLQGQQEPLVINTHTNAGEFSVQKAFEGVCEHINKNGLNFDSLFCVSDPTALGALRALHKKGINIPSEVSLIGYDDMDFSGFFQPALSTIRQNIKKLSLTALDIIHDKINANNNKCRHELLLPKLILRESTVNSM